MPVSFVASADSGGTVSTSSRSVDVPAGAQAGDVAVLFLERWDGSTSAFPTPTASPATVARGVTATDEGGSSQFTESRCYLLRLSGSESSLSLSWSGQRWSSLGAMFFAGVDPNLDLAAVPFDAQPCTSMNLAPNTVETVAGAALAHDVCDIAQGDYGAVSHEPPAGYTETYDYTFNEGSYAFAAADGAATASGASSNATVDLPAVTTLVALPPAATGPDKVTASFTASATPAMTVSVTVEAPGQVFADDFEDGIGGWAEDGVTAAWSTDYAHDGTHSVKLTPSGVDNWVGLESPQFDVTPGVVLDGSIWFYAPAALTQNPYVEFDFDDSTGTTVGQPSSPGATPLTPGEWTEIALTGVVVPDTAITGNVQANLTQTPASTDVVHIDTVTVTRQTAVSEVTATFTASASPGLTAAPRVDVRAPLTAAANPAASTASRVDVRAALTATATPVLTAAPHLNIPARLAAAATPALAASPRVDVQAALAATSEAAMTVALLGEVTATLTAAAVPALDAAARVDAYAQLAAAAEPDVTAIPRLDVHAAFTAAAAATAAIQLDSGIDVDVTVTVAPTRRTQPASVDAGRRAWAVGGTRRAWTVQDTRHRIITVGPGRA